MSDEALGELLVCVVGSIAFGIATGSFWVAVGVFCIVTVLKS